MHLLEKVYIPTGYNNGYPVFWDKIHPLATTDGRVFLHRHIASQILGRWLYDTEEVHHIDGNKLNYSEDNLIVLSKSEHSKLHNPNKLTKLYCVYCGIEYTPCNSSRKYCSPTCANASNVKDTSITKELLEQLKPGMTWVALGKMFGYSDVGIKKRARSLGCNL